MKLTPYKYYFVKFCQIWLNPHAPLKFIEKNLKSIDFLLLLRDKRKYFTFSHKSVIVTYTITFSLV